MESIHRSTVVLAQDKTAGLVPTNPSVQGFPGAKATCSFCHNFSSNGAQGAPPWTRTPFVPGEDIQKLIPAFPQALLTKVEIQMQHKALCIQANCKSHGMLSEIYRTCFLQKLSKTVLRDLSNENTPECQRCHLLPKKLLKMLILWASVCGSFG